MNDHATEALAARVERLERQNRRLRLGGLAALAVTGAVVLMGQASPPKPADEIRTRRLVVVDEAGKMRASLGVEKYQAGLTLYNDAESKRAVFDVDKQTDGGGLSFMATEKRTQVSLRAYPSGPIFGLYGDPDTQQIVLSALPNMTCLGIVDARGYSSFLGAAHSLDPKTMTKIQTSAASLVMMDKDQKVIWQAP